ncbi:MAG: hypothetical protein C4K60_15590 [Ideonella sp. MAG2]|nr:MAG: hypothetical protein C4K60_15590 [Ideonella sp. MAG2]
MTFTDHHVFRSHFFSIGREETSGAGFLSFPVSNQRADYEEHYRISEALFQQIAADPTAGLTFLQECRQRQHDDLLFLKPGTDRGVPVLPPDAA